MSSSYMPALEMFLLSECLCTLDIAAYIGISPFLGFLKFISGIIYDMDCKNNLN